MTMTAHGMAGLVARFTMSSADQIPPVSNVNPKARIPNNTTVRIRLDRVRITVGTKPSGRD